MLATREKKEFVSKKIPHAYLTEMLFIIEVSSPCVHRSLEYLLKFKTRIVLDFDNFF
jgi:hypothetical protein